MLYVTRCFPTLNICKDYTFPAVGGLFLKFLSSTMVDLFHLSYGLFFKLPLQLPVLKFKLEDLCVFLSEFKKKETTPCYFWHTNPTLNADTKQHVTALLHHI